MTDREIVELFTEAFPTSAVWVGWRLNKRQGEIVKAIAQEMEKRKAAVEVLTTSMLL